MTFRFSAFLCWAVIGVFYAPMILCGSISLTGIPSGTEGAPHFASTLAVDNSGQVTDASGIEFSVAGSISEPLAQPSHFSLTVSAAAVVEVTEGDSFGAIARRGGIDRDSMGLFGVRDSGSNGIDKEDGLNFGIDAINLNPALRVQIVSLSITYVDSGETGTIVNRNDTSKRITFDREGADNNTDIEIGSSADINVRSLELFVNGGTRDTDVATIFHSNPANSGGWRVAAIELDIVGGGIPPSGGGENPNDWRSTLYPDNWSPLDLVTADYYTDKILQDFSYAGYRNGDSPIPDVQKPIYDVTNYGADPTGGGDSRGAIQSAINDAASNGGGVVFMPTGTFRIDVSAGPLTISSSDIVLRGAGAGQTFLYNSTTDMRGKTALLVTGPSTASPYRDLLRSTLVTEDLKGPTQNIPVEDASTFSLGDTVVFRSDVTEDWITEHQEPGWSGYASRFQFAYIRDVIGVDLESNRIILNAPIRYSQFLRENPRLHILGSPVTEVGLEDFSIGNRQREETSGWGNEDYVNSGTAAYHVHDSYSIKIEEARNCWVRRVHSYRPPENTLEVHSVSNGMRVLNSSAMTLEDVSMQRVQYGGGGGNGYNIRIQHSMEVLLTGCVAGYNRHGLVFSHMGTSGNVIYNCLDQQTRWAASMENQRAGSDASDHHMHFSHSNLIDYCQVINSFFDARYRPFGGVPQHNITSAHSVFWNIKGCNTNRVVRTQQGRYGYAIGTRGSSNSVDTVGSRSQTDPIDHVEGVGQGENLQPASLYVDQLRRRQSEIRMHLTSPTHVEFPVNTLPIRFIPEIGSNWGLSSSALVYNCELISGPAVPLVSGDNTVNPRITAPGPGVYRMRFKAKIGPDGPVAGSREVDLNFGYPSGEPGNLVTVSLMPVADTYVKQDEEINYGSDALIRLKLNGNANGRIGFMRFDVSQFKVPDIPNSDATLVLQKTGGAGTYEALVYANEGGTWSELGMVWGNQPPLGHQVGIWNGGPEPGEVRIPINPILPRVDQETSLTLALVVTQQNDNSPVFDFGSRDNDNPDLRPRLDITMPESASYDDWLNEEGVPAQISDPGDRVVPGGPNLNSFLGGIDPTDPVEPLPDVWIENDQINFQIPWRLDLGLPAFFQGEWSSDLQVWYPLAAENWTVTELSDQRRLYELSLPMDGVGGERVIYRLKTEADINE